MNINEFEAQTRDRLERALNQLQTATLLIATLELQVSESGNTIKDLSRVIETFITQQKGSTEISDPQ